MRLNKTFTVASGRAARLRRPFNTHCGPPCSEESRHKAALMTFTSCVLQQLRRSAPPRTCDPQGVQVRVALSRESIRAAAPQRPAESRERWITLQPGNTIFLPLSGTGALKCGRKTRSHWNGFPVRAGRQVEEEEPGLFRIKDRFKENSKSTLILQFDTNFKNLK